MLAGAMLAGGIGTGRTVLGRVAMGLALVAGAGCGSPKSTISGEIALGGGIEPSSYITLEIRAVEYVDDHDARTRPLELSPFAESIDVEGLEFPYAFELVEGEFHAWSRGWAVAWLSQRGELGPNDWVLDAEPFGATRIELVEPGTHLAPVADDAMVIIHAPD